MLFCPRPPSPAPEGCAFQTEATVFWVHDPPASSLTPVCVRVDSVCFPASFGFMPFFRFFNCVIQLPRGYTCDSKCACFPSRSGEGRPQQAVFSLLGLSRPRWGFQLLPQVHPPAAQVGAGSPPGPCVSPTSTPQFIQNSVGSASKFRPRHRFLPLSHLVPARGLFRPLTAEAPNSQSFCLTPCFSESISAEQLGPHHGTPSCCPGTSALRPAPSAHPSPTHPRPAPPGGPGLCQHHSALTWKAPPSRAHSQVSTQCPLFSLHTGADTPA